MISESPAAGTMVNTGSSVNLVISAGVEVAVPNVVGDTQPVATAALIQAGLVNGTFTFEARTITAGDVISQNPAAGTMVASGLGVSLLISTGPFSAFEADSNVISVQNGVVGIQTLPTGLNEAVSNIISIQNGVIGIPVLPMGENEKAVSNLISVQNGTVGSLTLLIGKNEAVSNLISAQNGSTSAAATALLKSASKVTMETATNSGAGSGTTNGTASALEGIVLAAGETVTVAADAPAAISLNEQRAGNHPGSTTDLTFVVPEAAILLAISAGAGANAGVTVQRQTANLSGQVLDAKGLPAGNVWFTCDMPG